MATPARKGLAEDWLVARCGKEVPSPQGSFFKTGTQVIKGVLVTVINHTKHIIVFIWNISLYLIVHTNNDLLQAILLWVLLSRVLELLLLCQSASNTLRQVL